MCQGAKPATTTLIGNVIVGMFLVLPTESSSSDSENPDKTGQSLQQQGALVFKAMLYGESELCIPHISRGEQSGVIDIDRQRRRVAAVELLGALIGENTIDSLLISVGLNCISHNIHHHRHHHYIRHSI